MECIYELTCPHYGENDLCYDAYYNCLTFHAKRLHSDMELIEEVGANGLVRIILRPNKGSDRIEHKLG